MSEASVAPLGQVGRLLVATVHQAIVDELPARLDFYEHWLKGERVRDGGVGLAPMTAVLGFLRAEGDAAHAVLERAGHLAGDWTWRALPAAKRAWVQMLPRWFRLRVVGHLVAVAIREGHSPSRAIVRVKAGRVEFRIRHSLFCRVRERQARPLCDFHRALIDEAFRQAGLPMQVEILDCAATGHDGCVLVATAEGV